MEKSGEVWSFLCNFGSETYYNVRVRFLGNIEAKADTKGRAFLPAVFRKTLQVSGEDRLVLRKDVYEQCLVLYPEQVWNEQLDILRQRLNRWDKKQWQIFRQYVSDAEVVTLDGNGRFLIPKRYLKLAGIEQELKFIGVDDTIEIWSKERCDAPFVEPADFGSALQELMGQNGEETE